MTQRKRQNCCLPGCTNRCEPGQAFCRDHMIWGKDILKGVPEPDEQDPRWQEATAQFLEENPLCAFCQMEGKDVPAVAVDHIIPHRGDQRLFWDQHNWEPLCRECYERKTGTELYAEEKRFAI